MSFYKKLVALCGALAILLALTEINSLIIDSSSPFYDGLVKPHFFISHSFVWLLVYFLTAIVIADSIFIDNLREDVIYWGFLLVINTLWLLSLFIFDSISIAFAFMLIINILCISLFFEYIKKTKSPKALLILPVAVWYVFLLVMNFIFCLKFID